MSKVRFSIEYSEAPETGGARLSISRFEEGMIGYGVMRPMLFQQLLDHEVPTSGTAAMTDMWTQGETKTFLQAALDCAWRLGLRPQAQKEMAAPSYAFAEVSSAVVDSARELRARALAALAADEALAA